MPLIRKSIKISLSHEDYAMLIDFAASKKCALPLAATTLIRTALDARLAQYADKRLLTTKHWVKHKDAWQ